MKKKVKLILGGLLVGSMLIGLNVVTFAKTVKLTTSSYTTGKSQSIKITNQGYTDTFSPAAGAFFYKYGVFSYTPGYNNGNTITTNFIINGNGRTYTSTVPFSNAETNLEYCDACLTSTTNNYNSVDSIVKTNSSIYGNSTRECNFNV